ncbi:MAG: hypothetical protein ACK5X3_13870 [Pseudomonadota bacterium]|jgi:hypothetical protein
MDYLDRNAGKFSMFPENNAFYMGNELGGSSPSKSAEADGGGDALGGASSLGWLGGPKGAAAMAALQMVSAAAERQRKERLMEYESRLQRLRNQQSAAAAGQQMAQALRF